jgi:hypothetical protein
MVILLTVHLYCLIIHFELVNFSYRTYFPFFLVVLFSWEDYEKKFKDTTCVLRSHKSKDSQCTDQKNMINNGNVLALLVFLGCSCCSMSAFCVVFLHYWSFWVFLLLNVSFLCSVLELLVFLSVLVAQCQLSM